MDGRFRMFESYDLQEVRQAAIGHWTTVHFRVCGISDESLTGKHGPCPKHGGKDKWRTFDDYEKTGGAVCNESTHGKMADGFAVIQSHLGCSFVEAIKLVAECVGVQPKAKKQTEPQESLDPAKNLEFMGQNESMFSIFCLKKKGIKPAALALVGAQYAMYRKRHPVIAIPAKGQSGEIVGYCLYGATGKDLPIWQKGSKEPTEWRKIKVTAGSQPGWIGTERPAKPLVGWKTEGPSCLLALISLGLPEAHFASCNLFGAEEDPATSPWMLERYRDVPEAFVVHDCDKSGQSGALFVSNSNGKTRPGWAPAIANVAGRVRNFVLPYEMKDTHGQDMRDLVIQRTATNNRPDEVYQQLVESARRGDKIDAVELKAAPLKNVSVADFEHESIDDPHRLARINLEKYQKEHNRTLKYWKQTWYSWRKGVYEELSEDVFSARLNASIKAEFDAAYQIELDKYMTWRTSKHYSEDKDKGPPKVRKVTKSLVCNVLAATKSMVALKSSQKLNSWISKERNAHCLAVENGILNLDALLSGSKDQSEYLLPHSPDWFSTTKVKYAYNEQALCQKWCSHIRKAMQTNVNGKFQTDEESERLIQEWFGYLLTPKSYLQKFIAFEGDGSNGKSVILAGVHAIFGSENISNLTIDQFDKQFMLNSTLGKIVNISADAGNIDQIDEGKIKQFVGGDVMQFDRKHKEPVSASPTAKLMVAWNTRPRIKDRTNGMWRRLIVVPFEYVVSGDEIIHGMDDPDYWIRNEEASGMLNWAIVGLHRLRTHGRFTEPPRCVKALKEYKADSNPTASFIDECTEENPDSSVMVSEIYERYVDWCKKSGYHALAKANFGSVVLKNPKVRKTRREYENRRPWQYSGIKLLAEDY